MKKWHNPVSGEEFAEIQDLLVSIRKSKIKQKDFFERYYPKYDLLTNELIPYKDWKTYFKVDFLHKNNLNKWARQFPDKAVEWTKKYILDRKAEKNLVRAPSHFELRTLFCPSVKFLQEHTDYNALGESIGLTRQFDYVKELVFAKLPDKFTVYQDSREQTPLKYVNQIVKKLEYGDYTLDDSLNHKIFIERKSLQDAVGTFGRDYERFYREVERAKKDGAYLIVAVEVDYNKFASFDRDYRMRYATKVTPDYVLKNMRDLLLEFDNLQFVFVDGRVELAEKILKIFQLGEQAKQTDLQFAYEKGLL